jgi:hypothetical protein
MNLDTRGGWLHGHQLHVLATLAHIDGLIERIGEANYRYMAPPAQPLELENVVEGGLAHVTVRAVAPLPESIARCAADALTQMRAVLEHTIFAEVEHLLQRPLEQPQARLIEMPAARNGQDWQKWLARRRKAGLSLLAAGSTLAGRIDTLQPYHWGASAATHPLRILVEHTNQIKHRTPAIAATCVAKVRLDVGHPEVRVTDADARRPAEPGMRLVSGPIDFREEAEIWPTVAIRRPHTSMWHPLLAELGALEKWVREDALPRLLGVGKDLGPLPPQLDITQGHLDLRAAARQAGMIPAARRAAVRIGADAADVRPALADMLANHWPELADAVRGWVASLDDSTAVDLLERHANRSVAELTAMLAKLRTEIIRYESEGS